MRNDLEPLVFDFKGTIIPGYFINDHGDVYTSYRQVSRGRYGFETIITNEFHKMKPREKSKDYPSLYLEFSVPQHLIGDEYDYTRKGRTSNSNFVIKKRIHQLVMATFNPIDQNPPERLKECWNKIPQEAKEWIYDTVIINHKDHNPRNNHISNLEYDTPKENARKAVIFYGGNHANKSKIKKVQNKIKKPKTYLQILLEES